MGRRQTAREMREKARERQRRYREKLKEKGSKQITVVLDRKTLEHLEKLEAFLGSRFTRSQIVAIALRKAPAKRGW